MLNITINDNGTDNIEIYINDTLLTQISFSDVVTYDEDPHDNNEYYSKAVMKDNDGNVLDLFDSENRKIEELSTARIACSSHLIAFASRTESFDIDDITLSKKVSMATPEPTSTPTAVTQSPTKTTTPKTTEVNDKSSNTLAIGITIGALAITVISVSYIIVSYKKLVRR